MDKEYYKDYYSLERKHWWFRAREAIIINTIHREIRPTRKLNILNVGCATGRSTEYLSAFGDVTTVEYDKDCCEFLLSEIGIKAINASATELPFNSNTFDLVCAFDVIEHIEDHQLAVNELCRVVKNEQFVFVTVPTYMSLWSKHDVINHHFRRYKMNELKSLFINNKDGVITYNTYFNTIFFPLIWIARKLSNLIFRNKKEATSDFNNSDENKISDKIFYSIFILEKRLLNHIRFPFGVSAMLIWKKNTNII